MVILKDPLFFIQPAKLTDAVRMMLRMVFVECTIPGNTVLVILEKQIKKYLYIGCQRLLNIEHGQLLSRGVITQKILSTIIMD